MEAGTSKKSKFILIGLSLVFIAILAVGVGLVVKKSDGEEKAEEMTKVNCLEKSAATEISECIESNYREDGEREKMFSVYQKAIDEAFEEKDYDRATDLIIARSEFLTIIRDCTSALQLFESEDFGELGAKNRARIYTGAAGVGVECGDKNETEKWNRRLSEVMQQLEGTYYYEYSD